MLGFKGPAQPSPTLGDALNAGYGYLEVCCLGCNTHQTIAIVRRPKATPVHELERYMRCKDCSHVRGHPYKRSHLVALRNQDLGERSAVNVVARRAVIARLPPIASDNDCKSHKTERWDEIENYVLEFAQLLSVIEEIGHTEQYRFGKTYQMREEANNEEQHWPKPWAKPQRGPNDGRYNC